MPRTGEVSSGRIVGWFIGLLLAYMGNFSIARAESEPPVQNQSVSQLTNSDEHPRVGPFSALLGYSYDTRDFTTLNITTFTGRLPYGFTIWGFADISSMQGSGTQRFDLTRHFIEYRFRWNAPGAARNFGVELEYNDVSGAGNSVLRGGIHYKLALPFLEGSWLQLRTLPAQSRGRSSQLSVIHSIQISQRLSLEGFSDLNIPWNGGPVRVIAESQLLFQLTRELGIGVEARYNEFEDANMDLRGLGLGFALVAQL